MIDLIPLQTAYIRQSKDVRNNAWIVYDTDGRELDELSNTFTPEQAMSYLHFARRYELEALNIGINFGKSQQSRVDKDQIIVLKQQVALLEQQNIGLAAHLQNIIEGVI